MLITGTVGLQGAAVGESPIAFVLGKSILRINRIQFQHVGIAPHFGNDAGTGDAERILVAVDDAHLRYIAALGPKHIVEKEAVGLNIARLQRMIEGALHRSFGRAYNAESVDLVATAMSNAPGQGNLLDRSIQRLALRRAHVLTITYAAKRLAEIMAFKWQGDCSRRNRSSQGTTSYFIQAKNVAATRTHIMTFMVETSCFRFSSYYGHTVPVANCGESPRSRAAYGPNRPKAAWWNRGRSTR